MRVFGTETYNEDHFNIMNACINAVYIGKYAEFDACFAVHDWLSRIFKCCRCARVIIDRRYVYNMMCKDG